MSCWFRKGLLVVSDRELHTILDNCHQWWLVVWVVAAPWPPGALTLETPLYLPF